MKLTIWKLSLQTLWIETASQAILLKHRLEVVSTVPGEAARSIMARLFTSSKMLILPRNLSIDSTCKPKQALWKMICQATTDRDTLLKQLIQVLNPTEVWSHRARVRWTPWWTVELSREVSTWEAPWWLTNFSGSGTCSRSSSVKSSS